MSQALKELTNTYSSTPKLQKEFSFSSEPDEEQIELAPEKIQQLLSVNLSEINFGQCLPKTVLEKRLSITLKRTLPVARVISLHIVCQDQELNELPEYIFGIRKESSFEYFDEFKFKASQKGIYSFMIGVKTPCLSNYSIHCRLIISMDMFPTSNPIVINLRQVAKIPSVTCPKELIQCGLGHRVIKISLMKNKKGKQVKLPFRLADNMAIGLTGQIIGLNEGKQIIDIKPKCLQLSGKGLFYINVFINYTQSLNKALQEVDKGVNSYSIRRILVFRIKDTNYHYHFPLEISFYPSSSSNKNTETNSIE